MDTVALFHPVKGSDGNWYVAENGTVLDHRYGKFATESAAADMAATAETLAICEKQREREECIARHPSNSVPRRYWRDQ